MKSEMQAAILHDFGVTVEDRLEAARSEMHRLDGAKQALAQAARKVEEHLVHVTKDIDEGKIDLQQAEREKRRILECSGILRNLAIGAEVGHHVSRGKMEALQGLVATLAQSVAMAHERAKILSAAELVTSEVSNAQVREPSSMPAPSSAPMQRVVGSHPGPTLKQVRMSTVAIADAGTTVVESKKTTGSSGVAINTTAAKVTKGRKTR